MQEFSDILVFNEDRKKVDAMMHIHLPDGPTARYRINNMKLSKDIRNCGRATDHKVRRPLFAVYFKLSGTIRGGAVHSSKSARNYPLGLGVTLTSFRTSSHHALPDRRDDPSNNHRELHPRSPSSSSTDSTLAWDTASDACSRPSSTSSLNSGAGKSPPSTTSVISSSSAITGEAR